MIGVTGEQDWSQWHTHLDDCARENRARKERSPGTRSGAGPPLLPPRQRGWQTSDYDSRLPWEWLRLKRGGLLARSLSGGPPGLAGGAGSMALVGSASSAVTPVLSSSSRRTFSRELWTFKLSPRS